MRILIRKARTALAAAGILAASLGVAVAAPTAAHAETTYVPHTQHGCPAYALCIYQRGGGWQGDRPIHWSYPSADQQHWSNHRWYNLSGMYGTHRVFNNGQYVIGRTESNIESASINTGYNGGGKHYWIDAGKFVDVRDMGPWNSVTLGHDWYRS